MRKRQQFYCLAAALFSLGSSVSAYGQAADTTSTTVMTKDGSTINILGPAGSAAMVTQTPAMGGMGASTSVTTSSATPTCSQISKTDDTNNDCVTGLGLGAGVGEFFYATSSPDIKSATLESGPNNTSIVRVTESHRREAEAWLEGHYLWRVLKPGETGKLGKAFDLTFLDNLYMGPFAALQLGAAEGTFSSFGVGWLFSFKANSNPNDSKAFGLGFGYAWRQITQLGDGIEANKPLPTGLQNITMKKSDIGGFLLMMSFHFL